MSKRSLAALGIDVPKRGGGQEARTVTQATKMTVRVPQKAGRAMNRLESAYADILAAKQSLGDIRWWAYEAITLKLANDVRYTPDFAVIDKDGALSFVETKGFMRDDARVKIRVAAATTPFRFHLARWKGKAEGWDIQEVTE